MDTLLDTASRRVTPKVQDFCPEGPVHRCIHAVCHIIEDHAQRINIARRFCAMKLIEGEQDFFDALELSQNEKELIEHTVIEMEHETGLDRNAALADMRYNFIEKVCGECVVKAKESREHRRSMQIDKVLTHTYLCHSAVYRNYGTGVLPDLQRGGCVPVRRACPMPLTV